MTADLLNIKPLGRSVVTYKTTTMEIFMDGLGGRLSELYSIDRGKGYATKLMSMVCKWADANDVYLWLVAKPYGNPRDSLDKQKLIEFYKGFGFRFFGQRADGGYVMDRFPPDSYETRRPLESLI